MILRSCLRNVIAGAVLVAAISVFSAGPTQAGAIVLAPHRAVYDLKLLRAPGRRPIEAVRGRILYDFAGNSCEGYALQFRQVSELDSGEGKVALSDLRATTWEDGEGKNFRFTSQNFVDSTPVDAVDGAAERTSAAIGVSLKKPEAKNLDLDKEIVFPSEHMRRIIAAAQEGKSLVELPVFDGSETGQKVFNTLTVIGHEIDLRQKPLDDAAAKIPALAAMKRWPVTISYFDRTTNGGEQTPVYAIGFELFENGISRALSLDYGDFVVSGEMSQLDLRDAPPCKP
ncbi:MAG: cell envelope integrity EipB family protein [Xanthobacteraceae bacterium]